MPWRGWPAGFAGAVWVCPRTSGACVVGGFKRWLTKTVGQPRRCSHAPLSVQHAWIACSTLRPALGPLLLGRSCKILPLPRPTGHPPNRHTNTFDLLLLEVGAPKGPSHSALACWSRLPHPFPAAANLAAACTVRASPLNSVWCWSTPINPSSFPPPSTTASLERRCAAPACFGAAADWWLRSSQMRPAARWPRQPPHPRCAGTGGSLAPLSAPSPTPVLVSTRSEEKPPRSAAAAATGCGQRHMEAC